MAMVSTDDMTAFRHHPYGEGDHICAIPTLAPILIDILLAMITIALLEISTRAEDENAAITAAG